MTRSKDLPYTMVQKIIRAGKHSLAVIIPAQFVHALGIKPGDTVKVIPNIETGKVSLSFSGAVQLSLPTSEKKVPPQREKIK